jgi:hypothetical protein
MRDLGMKRTAGLEQSSTQRRADRQREPEARRPDRRARLRQDDVHTDGPQQRALARHVRAAHDQDSRPAAAEPHVVADGRRFVQERVSQRGRVEQRPFLEHGERIRRVLVRVRRERRQRLELADHAEPLADGGPVRGVPPIDRRRQLAAQEQQQSEHREELIARRVHPRDEPRQRRDAGGWHHLRRGERVAQRHEAPQRSRSMR